MPREGGAFALAGRSVVGAGFALPRDAGRRPALQERSAVSAWFRAPARCRSETPTGPGGWGIRVGRAQCCRRWFRAPARCRSEALVSRSGDAGRRPALQEGGAFALAGRGVVGAGFALPRAPWALALAGAVLSALVSRSRAMPVGGPHRRSSAPGGWGTRVGWARCCRGWFRAPARCRSETGAPTEGAALALAGRSVVGAGFALPRDAGRRPALQLASAPGPAE